MKQAIAYVIAYVGAVLTTVFLEFFLTWLTYITLGDPWQIVVFFTSVFCSPWIAQALDKRFQSTLLRKTA
ncbi:MAG: hypothetical protein ACXWP0_01300 [Ktedonobacterales bacterium]